MSIRAFKTDSIYANVLWFARGAINREIDNAAAISDAQFVPFIRDPNLKYMLFLRGQSIPQHVDPLQMQFGAVLCKKILLFPV